MPRRYLSGAAIRYGTNGHGLGELALIAMFAVSWLGFTCPPRVVCAEEKKEAPKIATLGIGWRPVFFHDRGSMHLLFWTETLEVRSPYHPEDRGAFRLYVSTLSLSRLTPVPSPAIPALRLYAENDPWPEFDAFGAGGAFSVTYRALVWLANREPTLRATVPLPPPALPELPWKPATLLRYKELQSYQPPELFAERFYDSMRQWRSLLRPTPPTEILFSTVGGGCILASEITQPLPVEGPGARIEWPTTSPCPFWLADDAIGLLYLKHPSSRIMPYASEVIQGKIRSQERPRPCSEILRVSGKMLTDLETSPPHAILPGWRPYRTHLWQSSADGVLWLLLLSRDGPELPEKGAIYEHRGHVALSKDYGVTWTEPKEVFHAQARDLCGDIAVENGILHVAHSTLDGEGLAQVHLRTEPSRRWLRPDEEEESK